PEPVRPPRRKVAPGSMFIKYLLPLVALGLLIFAFRHVFNSQRPEPIVPPPIEPARSPFSKTLAGAGVVEAQTENIAIGSTMPGLGTEVYVRVGVNVKAGDRLFKLDDRPLVAEMAVRKAALVAAQAELVRLQSQPRQENLPIYQATVDEAKASVAETLD